MTQVKIHDKIFEPYLLEEEIKVRIEQISNQINIDFANKQPLFIAILNGSFMFASDLFKRLKVDAELCFIKLASYNGLKSGGNVVTTIGLEEDIYNRHIIIVEDIVDTGKTLSSFLPKIAHQNPASISIATLLYKPDAHIHPLTLNYVGFEIPDKFVVGYGLDYNGLGRNLCDIYQVIEN